MLIDFQKAFDSVSQKFLSIFGFKDSFGVGVAILLF